MRAPGPPKKPASLWRTLKAMAWALLGVRKDSAWHEDAAHIRPLHIVVVGVVAIFVLVLLLIALVHWVV